VSTELGVREHVPALESADMSAHSKNYEILPKTSEAGESIGELPRSFDGAATSLDARRVPDGRGAGWRRPS